MHGAPRIRTDLPHEVVREDVWLPLPDGTRLFARVWRPRSEGPVPALLEYLPYRLTDWTSPRDEQRHPRYAGHGYASVRVDVRGHGNSEGRPGDEYDETELADGVAVLEWLAAQPWCSGKVGMFGISWGGFNSLQIAALAPEPLRAIVTVCSTDDRYDNDVHYIGGAVLGVDMHAWAATMLAFVARPPDPAYVGDNWEAMWRQRLDGVQPFVHNWLAHQVRDDYWRHGSVCEDYSRIEAAVLAVGGWHDPYRDTVLRLLEHLPADRVRGIVGPWSHQYPDRGLPPGPAIGFLQETLRWWDQHLKAIDSGVMDEPPLRAYICDSHRPATTYDELPGRWVGLDPASPALAPQSLDLTHGLRTSDDAPELLVDTPQHTGLAAGRFFPFGNDADLPPDQREEDGRSVCLDSAPFTDPLDILGRPVARLRLRPHGTTGHVIVRLCEVHPDGASTLVTRGVLNLTARHGRDRISPCDPGRVEEVTVELNAVGYRLAPGSRLRVALSSTYWPWVWPTMDPATGRSGAWTLLRDGSTLTVPVVDVQGLAEPRFEPPEQTPGLVLGTPPSIDGGDDLPADAVPEREVSHDVAARSWRLDVDPGYGGNRTYPDGLEFVEQARETYVIEEPGPLTAHAESQWTVGLSRPDRGWSTRVQTRSRITCTATEFITDDKVTCTSSEELIFERHWHRAIPRTAG